jgi:capsular exopolysaccharide family
MKIKKELITYLNTQSPVSEVFRTLRTNIQFMNADKKLETLLITSTFPGEGKSWVSSNLAVTFAKAENKVVLIDADMRKGRQHTIFGTLPTPGLSNCLSDMNEKEVEEIDFKKYIQNTEVENLDLLPAGNIPPNPSELLTSQQMKLLLEKLKETYDLIIIDGTPCELVTDAVILSRTADSTLIVTAYKQTKKDSLERVIKNIKEVGGKLAGVVINKMPMDTKKHK